MRKSYVNVCVNEYVFHVNFAHKAYYNGPGKTLHFFSHANMHTCNQQMEIKDSKTKNEMETKGESKDAETKCAKAHMMMCTHTQHQIEHKSQSQTIK